MEQCYARFYSTFIRSCRICLARAPALQLYSALDKTVNNRAVLTNRQLSQLKRSEITQIFCKVECTWRARALSHKNPDSLWGCIVLSMFTLKNWANVSERKKEQQRYKAALRPCAYNYMVIYIVCSLRNSDTAMILKEHQLSCRD